MIIELHNNGELIDSKNMFGTLEFAKNGLRPTRIGLLNMQTLMVVYHVSEKLEFVECEPIIEDGHKSYMVGYYKNWYKECLDELLIPLIVI